MRIGIALELAEWGECGRKDGKYDRRRRRQSLSIWVVGPA